MLRGGPLPYLAAQGLDQRLVPGVPSWLELLAWQPSLAAGEPHAPRAGLPASVAASKQTWSCPLEPRVGRASMGQPRARQSLHP
jgi:hypothetical protein